MALTDGSAIDVASGTMTAKPIATVATASLAAGLSMCRALCFAAEGKFGEMAHQCALTVEIAQGRRKLIEGDE